MRRPLLALALAPALAVVLALLALFLVNRTQAGAATVLSIDTDPTGNTDTSHGTINTCLEVAPSATGIPLDVVIDNVADLAAFQFTLNYTGSVTARSVAVSLMNNETPDKGGSAEIIGASNPLPDSDGTHLLLASNDSAIGSGGATGSGLLINFTMSAPASPGTYALSITNSTLNNSVAGQIAHSTAGAEMHVTDTPDGSCPTQQVKFGDGDCNGAVGIGDAQKTARTLIDLSVTQTEPCPDIGTTTSVNGVDRVWGDVDCSGPPPGISDAQKTARYLVGLSVSQTEPCPDIGEQVQVPAA